MNSNLDRIIFFILFLGIIISTSYAYFNIKKFDKNGSENNHLMIRGDLGLIFQESYEFQQDYKSTGNFFGSGKEYTRTFLPSKILALYYFFSGEEIYENYDQKKIKIGNKFCYFLFQIFLFYLCLYFLYLNLIKFYNNKVLSLSIISYLSLDFNIIQWHGTFWTESIFFSLQILLISLIIARDKSFKIYLIIGLLLGLIFLQKTVGILFIIFVITYFFLEENSHKYLKNFLLLSSFSLVMFFLAYDNYIKTGLIYVLPMQTKTAHYVYVASSIVQKKEGSLQSLKAEENKWKRNNFFKNNDFKSKYDFMNFKQQKALSVMMDNKLETFKIYFKNTLAHLNLNPLQTYFWHEYNKDDKKNQEFHKSEMSKKYFFIKILYSLLIYPIIIIGFFSAMKDKKKLNFNLLILIFVFYMIFMLGWVGNSRYFVPSLIFLSIFFGNGLHKLINIFLIK